MLRFDLLSWWYFKGWPWSFKYFFITRNQHVIDFFSADDLVKTLFAPYRQTFAGSSKGSLSLRLRSMIDTLISRVVGFIVRLVLLFATVILIFMNTMVAFAGVVLWPLAPLTPPLALMLLILGLSNAV